MPYDILMLKGKIVNNEDALKSSDFDMASYDRADYINKSYSDFYADKNIDGPLFPVEKEFNSKATPYENYNGRAWVDPMKK